MLWKAFYCLKNTGLAGPFHTQTYNVMQKQAPPIKRWFSIVALLAVAVLGASLLPACSTKTGCPANESLRAPVDSKGNLKKPKGRTKSGLFPKDMERRMQRGSRK